MGCNVVDLNKVTSNSKPQEGLLCYGYLADIKQTQDAKPQSQRDR